MRASACSRTAAWCTRTHCTQSEQDRAYSSCADPSGGGTAEKFRFKQLNAYEFELVSENLHFSRVSSQESTELERFGTQTQIELAREFSLSSSPEMRSHNPIYDRNHFITSLIFKIKGMQTYEVSSGDVIPLTNLAERRLHRIGLLLDRPNDGLLVILKPFHLF